MRLRALAACAAAAVALGVAAGGCGSDDETASEAAGKTTPQGTGAAPTPPLPEGTPTD